VTSLRHILETSLANGARPALLFAAAVVAVGAALSFLIPRLGPPSTGGLPGGLETIDPVEALDVMDVR
jgi:hypothetical protein